MADTEIKQPLVPADPELQDLLELMKKNIMISLACHHLGTIQSFDPANQTATASINYKKTYFDRDPATGLYNPVLTDYPILLDCPVIVLGGGPASLTMPIAKGDQCLVLFNDRDIDNWFKGGQVGPLATPRLHSLADGLIIVGVRSLNKVIQGYDDERAVLQYGTTMVAVGESLVKIANDQYTLKTLLQQLITQLQDLVTQTAAITVTAVTPGMGVSGVPANAAAITAIATDLGTTATQLGELLE